jgi:topoisomerase IA-like protein
LNLFLLQRFREYKEEEFRCNGRYGPYIRHGAALCLCQRRKSLDIDFERAEKDDEKAIADAPVAFI